MATAVLIGASALGAATSVYSAVSQRKTAKDAAKYNADAQRSAAKVASNDARNNALRRQESHRKYISSLRANMLAQNSSIEGANMDFLDESVGDLQLRVLDASVANNRNQANFENNALRYEYRGEQASKAGAINIGASVLNGVAGVYSAGHKVGYWGGGSGNQQKITQQSSII